MHRIVHICYMPHSYVRYLIHMCEMSHATHCNTLQEMWHAAFIREMPHSYTHMHEALHTYEWGIAHIWKRHCTHTNSRKGSDNVSHDVLLALKEAYHTYEWNISHMNEIFHIWMKYFTYEWDISHMNEIFHIWMKYFTYEWNISHMNEISHIWILIHIYDMPHSYVRCLIRCPFYYSYVCNASFECVIGLF